MIPELVTPTYLEMRDRITSNGRHWIGEDMCEFLSQKLSENNQSLSSEARQWALRKNSFKNLMYLVKRLNYYLINGKWSVLRRKFQSFVRL